MEYKGYIGQVEYDDEAKTFHGEVVNTRDVITFQGDSVAQLEKAFRDSVDDYLAFCAERGEEPDKPFSGQFLARLNPDLHRRIAAAAARAGLSLNAWLAQTLQIAVDELFGARTAPRPAHGPRGFAGTAKTRAKAAGAARGKQRQKKTARPKPLA